MTPITAKTGLILEGGAMRGMYTAGVCDVLMEQNITFDGCIGVSAGATFGCNFKSRQIGRTIRYNTKYSRDPRYASFRSLLLTGNYFGTKFCYDEIPNRLDPFDYETYQSNPMPFYIVCTDADTGEALYQRADTCDARDLTYMRASASMPLFSRIVEVDGYHLSDGGTADSIPLVWFREQGYARNLIVLTRPEGYRKSPSSPVMNALLRLSQRNYPALAKALEQRHIGYSARWMKLRRQNRPVMFWYCVRHVICISDASKKIPTSCGKCTISDVRMPKRSLRRSAHLSQNPMFNVTHII